MRYKYKSAEMHKNLVYFSVSNLNVNPSMLFNHASNMAVWMAMSVDWSVCYFGNKKDIKGVFLYRN